MMVLGTTITVSKTRHRQSSIFYTRLQALRPIHIKHRRIDAVGAGLHEPHSRRPGKQHPRLEPCLRREYRKYLY